MLKRTSFNQAFLAKIRAAMRDAVETSARWSLEQGDFANGVGYVANRRDRLMMRVDYHPQRGFRFWEQSRTDKTVLVTQALGGIV